MRFSTYAKPQPSSSTISRRQWLQLGGAGLLTMSLPGVVTARVDEAAQGGAAEKSCIFILLCGGPSHVDTWDLKPDAPAEIRGPYKPIATQSSGHAHQRTASAPGHADRPVLPDPVDDAPRRHQQSFRRHAQQFERRGQCALGRSLHRFRAGQAPTQPAHHRVLRLADQVRRRSGFLRPEHRHGRLPGDALRPAVRRHGRQQSFNAGFSKLPKSCYPRRTFRPSDWRIDASLLEEANPAHRRDDGRRGRTIGMVCRAAPFELAASSEARRAFKVDREDPRCATLLRPAPAGSQNLLLARRLVESGVGFVTVNGWTGPSPTEKLGGPPSSSWDMHGSNMGHGQMHVPEPVPMAWAGACRGSTRPCPRCWSISRIADLLDNTLLVIFIGEFGRTPKIHHGRVPRTPALADLFSAITSLAEAFAAGEVYGESDKIARPI